MTTDLTKLRSRWQRATGEPMPEAIADLPIERIQKAVKLVEAGHTVFVPSDVSHVRVDRKDEPVSSMRDWDKHGEFS